MDAQHGDDALAETTGIERMSLLLYLLLSAAAFYALASVVPGIRIERKRTALGAAVLFGLLHVTLYKVLYWITFPITFVTFGLWVLVLNAGMIGLTAKVFRRMRVDGCGSLLIASVVLTVIHVLLRALLF